mmetsp:Transcript_36383/g.96746  ORF Transcript_36383/g.96746 Transcript_36383/m.96746 type:complete len:254 (+) Transcript_36383:195-956(+)
MQVPSKVIERSAAKSSITEEHQESLPYILLGGQDEVRQLQVVQCLTQLGHVGAVDPLHRKTGQFAVRFSRLARVVFHSSCEDVTFPPRPIRVYVEESFPLLQRIVDAGFQFHVQPLSLFQGLFCDGCTLCVLRPLRGGELADGFLHNGVERAASERWPSDRLPAQRALEFLVQQPRVHARPAESVRTLDVRGVHQPILANTADQFRMQVRDVKLHAGTSPLLATWSGMSVLHNFVVFTPEMGDSSHPFGLFLE